MVDTAGTTAAPPASYAAATAIVEFPGKGGSSFARILGRLRLRHLSLLVALDDHRNLHRAARAVHLAQPTASKLVHDLELVLGFQLFERLPTGMQPTEPSTAVLTFARRTLRDLKRLSQELDNRRLGRDENLVIGTAMDFASDIVACAMTEIKQRRPMLIMSLLSGTTDEIIHGLIEGRTDLAIGCFGDVSRNSEIDFEVIGKEALYTVARKDHPLCRQPHLNLFGLERASWIFPPHGSSTCQPIEYLVQCGMRPPTNIVESNSITATLNLMLSSDAIAILPESAVRSYLRTSLLVRLSAPICECLVAFGILSRRGETQSPLVAEFSQLLRHYGGSFRADSGPHRNVVRF